MCVCAHPSVVSNSLQPMGYSPPGSSVHGISQARILEWVAIPYPGDLPDPGIEPTSLEFPALADEFLIAAPAGKPLNYSIKIISVR